MPTTADPRPCPSLLPCTLALIAFVVPIAGAGAQGVPIAQLAPPDAVAPGTYTSIRAVRELADGRVLVSDRVERRLVLLDLDEGISAGVGGRGQGPGEYSVPNAIHPLPGDSSIVSDASTRRWLILHGEEVVDTWAARRTPTAQLSLDLAGVDGEGRILGLGTHRYTPPEGMPGLPGDPVHADSLVLVRVDRWREAGEDEDARVADTLAVLAGPGTRTFCFSVASSDERSGGRVGGCSPVSGRDGAVPFPDGWLAVVSHDPYRVDWRTPVREWVRGRPFLAEARSFASPVERCVAVRGYPFRGVERPCEQAELAGREWPERVPPFLSLTTRAMAGRGTPGLYAAPDGRLVVRRTPEPGADRNRYDLVDRRGSLDAVLNLPANEAIVGFGEASVYVVETDPFDVQTLRRHPWP